jgi:hypothetical protein
MNRTFAISLLASLVCTAVLPAADREFYELRTYQLNSPEKAATFDIMMAAAIPVLNKAGVSPVGVFKGKREKDGDPNWRHVLMAAKSLDTLAASRSALVADEAFLQKAHDYVSFAKDDPAYARISVSTFIAFEGFPKLVSPAPDNDGERFYELRIYESHSELKAFMKVAMFNNGELDIFADSKLRGVFFGSALSGDNIPNLTYMLVYNNEAEHKKVWDAFRKAPAWNALNSEKKYAETVSKITSLFLVPTDYSGLK